MGYAEVRYATEEEWAEARRHGVGGSDVSAIMGINRYKTPAVLWLEKTGRIEPDDLSQKQAVEWGNRLEDAIAAKFAENHPDMMVRKKNCTCVSRERPWAFANIDREVLAHGEQPAVLEIKTVGLRREEDWVFGVPDYYMTQVIHYLSVLGRSKAYVAVLIGGQEYREYEVEPDEEDMRAVDEAVDRFWQYVEEDTMPAVVGMECESKALAKAHPEHDGTFMVTTDAALPILAERHDLMADRKAIDARIKAIDAKLKAIIGDRKGIETESVRATWVRSRAKVLDTARLRLERPRLVEEYTVERNRDGGIRLSFAGEGTQWEE